MKRLSLILLAAAVLTGCISVDMQLQDAKVGVSNAATEHCLQQKGFVDYQTNASGQSIAVCHLPDGRTIEVWQLYRSH